MEENSLAFGIYQPAQFQELVVVHPALLQAGGVLRPAQGQIGPGLIPGLAHKTGRRGVWPGGVEWVKLEREEIKARLGLHLGEERPGDRPDVEEPTGFKRQFDDRAPY